MDDAHLDEDSIEFEERLRAMLTTGEVMSILFSRVAHSMIVDFRRQGEVGPRIMTDPLVATPHDRYLSFGRLRPLFPLPDQLTMAFWMYSVREFAEDGMLALLENRARESDGEPLVAELKDSYRFLLNLERQYLRNMVRGVGMRTLWKRPRE
ncbi:MAG: hypothetical protein M3Y37_02250 [Chloroflexota bacterium]|jgi:hypothetical protein|nr:hypothetical protein [Chloroflexota bacterium]